MTIQVPCTFDAASRRKDKTVGMRFTSNYEVTNEDFAEMDRLMGNTGWVLFSPNEFKDADSHFIFFLQKYTLSYYSLQPYTIIRESLISLC